MLVLGRWGIVVLSHAVHRTEVTWSEGGARAQYTLTIGDVPGRKQRGYSSEEPDLTHQPDAHDREDMPPDEAHCAEITTGRVPA